MLLTILYYITGIGITAIFIYALIQQSIVRNTFNKYSSKILSSGLPSQQIVEKMFALKNVNDVKIIQHKGTLTDHYNPRKKIIALSQSVYNSNSLSAVGVAAHEASHAIQDKENYAPMKFRKFIVPFVTIGSYLFIPLLILGVVFSILGYYYGSIIIIIALSVFALTTIFELITLIVEKDASKKAIKILKESGMINEQEQQDIREVLHAAELTYLISFLMSLLYLLYYAIRLFMVFGKRN